MFLLAKPKMDLKRWISKANTSLCFGHDLWIDTTDRCFELDLEDSARIDWAEWVWILFWWPYWRCSVASLCCGCKRIFVSPPSHSYLNNTLIDYITKKQFSHNENRHTGLPPAHALQDRHAPIPAFRGGPFSVEVVAGVCEHCGCDAWDCCGSVWDKEEGARGRWWNGGEADWEGKGHSEYFECVFVF